MKDTEKQDLLLQLGKRIKQLREEKGLTQYQCYSDTNIHFGRLEQGRNNVSYITLIAVCKYFDISLKDFFENQ